MRLSILDAHFVRYESRVETWERVVGDPMTWKRGDPVETVTGPREYSVPVTSLGEAQGIRFRCPKCATLDVLDHDVEVTFAGRGVADYQGCHNKVGVPTRWTIVGGSSAEDLTTQPSILLEGGCGWHGFITNGDAA